MRERVVGCSESMVLYCPCGEKLVLLGGADDWRSRNAIFRCHCGEKLTLDDRMDEEAELVQNLGGVHNEETLR